MRALIMTVLIFAQLSLYAQVRKLSVTLNKQPISVLFKQIQEQCKYNIIYSDDIVADTALISL